jgi:PAS domain S-box-containing protein
MAGKPSREHRALFPISFFKRMSDSIASILVKQSIPAAIVVPLIIDWSIRQGELAGWYDSNFGRSLMTLSLMFIALGLITRSAFIINKIDGDRKRSSDRLRSSEERLKLALTGANQGIWDWDLTTKILTWDDRCKKIFGLPSDFPVNYEWHLNALHPDDRDRVFEAVAIALRDQTEFNEEYRTFHPDGTMHWILARGRGYYNATGEAYRMSGTVLDISLRKQSEASLVETNSILQAVINGTDDVIFVKDLQGRYVIANQAAARWLNITVEAILGQDDRALFPADVAQQIQAGDQQVINSEELISYEEQLLLQNDMRTLLSVKYPWLNNQDEITDIIGISRDITHLKQTRTELQERSDHLQLLYEITRDLLSSQQPLTLVKTLFTQLKQLIELDVYFNYIVDEQQQKLHLMFSGGISDEMAREIEWLEIGQAICGTVAEQKCQIVQPNLQQCTDPKAELVRSLGLNAYSCQPLVSQGKLFGTLGFGSLTRTNFTSAETQLFQAICDRIAIALERAEMLSSLQQQTEELIKANRLKDEFLAALSHELRTPLNPILGWTKLLQTQKLTVSKTTEALTTIERNVKQQIALVDDLLDISTVIQGQLQLISKPVDLLPIINAALDSVRFTAIAKCITLEFHSSDSITQVMGDDTRLQQVFWNLLSNAIKFTPDGGRVDVWVKQSQNQTQISIKDTGIGISPEFLPYVFDRFRQADGSTTRRYGGLGLGLAIVKHLVEMHGGTVSAASLGEGKGATFQIKLPLLQEESLFSFTTDNLIQPQTNSSLLPSDSLTGIQVLVVDDEPDNLDLINFLLTQEGASVTAVTSATEALTIVSKNPPDILVSDIGMPEMDGYKLLQQIRALPNQQDKPIKAIALTAFAYQEDEEKAIRAGFQMYLAKPVNLIELVEAIASVNL